jgi:hypothetical protein
MDLLSSSSPLGSALPGTKEFKRGADIVGIQHPLAFCILAARK